MLNKKFPEDKFIICLLNTKNCDIDIDKDINIELYNYHYQTINYDEISIDLCYKLISSSNATNNKYIKYNIENNLMNTIIIFNSIT